MIEVSHMQHHHDHSPLRDSFEVEFDSAEFDLANLDEGNRP